MIISDEYILDYTDQYRKEYDGVIIKYGHFSTEDCPIIELRCHEEIPNAKL